MSLKNCWAELLAENIIFMNNASLVFRFKNNLIVVSNNSTISTSDDGNTTSHVCLNWSLLKVNVCDPSYFESKIDSHSASGFSKRTKSNSKSYSNFWIDRKNYLDIVLICIVKHSNCYFIPVSTIECNMKKTNLTLSWTIENGENERLVK